MADPKRRVLLVVHPGSCCGSATFNLGASLARGMREDLVEELRAWRGDVLVMDGSLSDELPDHPELDAALRDAVARAPVGHRLFACDDEGEHFTSLLPRFVAQSEWRDPQGCSFALTGAWYSSDGESGCVTASRDALEEMGYTCEVLDSAFVEIETEPL